MIWSSISEYDLQRTVVENSDSKTDLNTSIQTIVQHQATTTTLHETITSTLAAVNNIQTSDVQSSSATGIIPSELRLPPIQIPDFDGDLTNWIRFKDIFVAMVDSKANTSEVEKLEYLQSKLVG